MSIFSKIGSWLEGLFKKARPGLFQFLHDNEAVAVAEVTKLAKQFAGIPLHQWRDAAFKVVGEAVQGGLANPGTWITMLVQLGYDIYKQAEATSGTPAAGT